MGAGCSYMPTIDPYLFTFRATINPKSSHQAVEDAIWAEIEKVQQTPVKQSELDKAIKQTRAQFAFSSESVTNQAY
ncbi:MAG: insulinase family protein [Caldilineaceae bacterium]